MLEKLIIYTLQNQIYTLGYNKDGVLEYFLSESAAANAANAVYLTKITHINSHNHLVFAEYAKNCTGVLNMDKHEKVQCGSKLLCQLTWAGDSEKQAKLSTAVSLSGKYVVVLMDSQEHYFAKNLLARDKVQAISQRYIGYGIIFRSAINNLADISQVSAEIDFLLKQRELVLEAVDSSVAPLKILPGEYKYQQLLKNSGYSDDFSISTNCETIFDYLNSYINLWAIDELNLDTKLDIDLSALSQQISSEVVSSSGIRIKLHILSGINLIDIDSNNAKLNFFQINYLAVDKVVQQIKLQDLTGIILIDFIKNMTIKEQQKITSNLSALLQGDWRKTTVLGFSKAGICEIIRSK